MLPPQAISTASKPYLGAIGAPPLRFQEPAPPPDLVTRPSAAAPPHPASSGEITDATLPHAAPPVTTAITLVNPTAVPANQPTDSATAPETEAPAPARTPPPILRDEIHRQTRAEDFLPFFQIPTTQPGDVTVVPVPRTPAPLPPSTATYTQTPR